MCKNNKAVSVKINKCFTKNYISATSTLIKNLAALIKKIHNEKTKNIWYASKAHYFA